MATFHRAMFGLFPDTFSCQYSDMLTFTHMRGAIAGLATTMLIACAGPETVSSGDKSVADSLPQRSYTVKPIPSTSPADPPRKRIVENTRAFLRALPKGQPVAYDRKQPDQGFFDKAFSAKPNDGRIRIAILLPLSAENEEVRAMAQNLLDAAQLALFDLRRPELTLLVHDTQGTAEGAGRAAQRTLKDGAEIIIGPLFAAGTQAVAPLARTAGVPVLSFSNNRDMAGSGVWLMGFLPEQNLDRIIEEAVLSGHKRFAALIPETPYGQRMQAALEPTISFYGGELVMTETYQDEAQSMLVPVQRIALFEERKLAWAEERDRLTEEATILLATLPDPPVIEESTPPEEIWAQLEEINPELKKQYDDMRLTETFGELPYDAVILPEGGIRLRTLAPLLPYFDVNPRAIKFLGTGLWDDPTLGQEPPLVGGWYAAPDPSGWRSFSKRYEQIYGRPAPRLASLAYDSISLVAALTDIYPNAPFTYRSLTTPNGFQGIDGIFRLTQNGLNERGLAVLEVRRKRNANVADAPNSFVGLDQKAKRPDAETAQDQPAGRGLLPGFSLFD